MIAPGLSTDVLLAVQFDQEPGAVVENAFLILLVRSAGDWRLLARVRVTAGARGEPLAGPALVMTTQRVKALTGD